jgi:hypothetical protein
MAFGEPVLIGPPNESRLSGGHLNPPGAQHLPYLRSTRPAITIARTARRCRRWLGRTHRVSRTQRQREKQHEQRRSDAPRRAKQQ